MKSTFYILSCLLVLSGTLTSCQKWLDITPSDQFSSDDLYTEPEGFLKALNGIYLEMTDRSSYGEYLSVGAVDVLAHYYHINPLSHNHRYKTVSTYAYEDASTQAIFSGVWSKNYALIANANVLLEKLPAQPNNLLPEPHYSIVKGEALGLRAFLHFDMLRLFGPLWNAENVTAPTLPYALDSESEVHPLVSAENFIQHVIEDLEAALLLMENDPVRTDGVRDGESASGDNSLQFRQYRFNYFAIKTLLTRVYLWKKEEAKAYTLSQELLAEIDANNTFPFVTREAATATSGRDRMFSTEVIFSLYDMKRGTLFNNLFSSTLTSTSKLSFNLDNTNMNRVNELYDDENDYRRAIWQLRTDNSVTSLTNIKYEFASTSPDRFMMPLIRLSELYLIAAETAPDFEDAVEFLNTLRTHRNCVNLNPSNRAELIRYIGLEYRKEFIGEGQTFFYEKRIQSPTIPRADQLTGTMPMFAEDYVVPLPENEVSIRQ